MIIYSVLWFSLTIAPTKKEKKNYRLSIVLDHSLRRPSFLAIADIMNNIIRKRMTNTRRNLNDLKKINLITTAIAPK